MTPEIRELFDEKIANIIDKINVQYEYTQKKLEEISKQTTQLDLKTEKIKDTIQGMIIADKDHYILCPNTKRIKEMEDENKDVNFFARNPKLGASIIAGVVLMILFSLESKFPTANNAKIDELNERLTKFEYYYRHPNDTPVLRGDAIIKDTIR